jgi:hypothetical protein
LYWVSRSSQGRNKVHAGDFAERFPQDFHMQKKVVAQKDRFDALLSSVLRAKPMPRKKIKTAKRHSPTPILSKP